MSSSFTDTVLKCPPFWIACVLAVLAIVAVLTNPLGESPEERATGITTRTYTIVSALCLVALVGLACFYQVPTIAWTLVAVAVLLPAIAIAVFAVVYNKGGDK